MKTKTKTIRSKHQLDDKAHRWFLPQKLSNSYQQQFKVDESRYTTFLVVTGSIGKLFLIDFVNIYLLSVFFSIVFVNIYLFSINIFSIDFARLNIGSQISQRQISLF